MQAFQMALVMCTGLRTDSTVRCSDGHGHFGSAIAGVWFYVLARWH